MKAAEFAGEAHELEGMTEELVVATAPQRVEPPGIDTAAKILIVVSDTRNASNSRQR